MNDDTEHVALLLRLYAFLDHPEHIELEYSEQAEYLCEAINAYFEKRGLRVDYSDLAGIGLFLPKEQEG
jgi:hypothetical protein